MSRNAPMRDWSLDCKVYVGDLGYGCAKQELEEKFSKYGQLRNVWVARKPPGFAFVEFEDSRDAEDAVRAIDGSKINGRRVRVEMSSGRSRMGNRGGSSRGGGFGGGRQQNDNYRGGGGGGGGGAPPNCGSGGPANCGPDTDGGCAAAVPGVGCVPRIWKLMTPDYLRR
uniref:RRM domain-containing protein n=1 Tax=Arion vulgaris TaxID=1028688 RepID=A0A0B6ZLL1_9EUPU